MEQGIDNSGRPFYGGGVTGLAFSGDGQSLATWRHGEWVQLWDVKTGRRLGSFQTAPNITGLAFLAGSETIVTSSFEQDLQVWKILDRTKIVLTGSIPAHRNEICSVAASPDGKSLASGCKDGTIKLWSPEVFRAPSPLNNQIAGQEPFHVAFAKDEGTILTITTNFALAYWKSETLEPLGSQQLPRDWIRPVLSPKGTQLAVGLPDGAVQIWNVSSRGKAPVLSKELLPAQGDNSQRRFAWSADGTRLAAFVGGIYVFDVVQGRLIRKLSIPFGPNSMAVSHQADLLAVGFNRVIELWDLATGVKVSDWEGHTEFTRELAFSPDGKTLASANNDNTAKLWHVPSGKLKADLTSHKLAVLRLAFSPDGRTLATLGVDAFKLWNVHMGQELMTLERFTRSDQGSPSPGRVVFSPDGTTLALGYYSPPRIQFWRAPAFAEIDAMDGMRK